MPEIKTGQLLVPVLYTGREDGTGMQQDSGVRMQL